MDVARGVTTWRSWPLPEWRLLSLGQVATGSRALVVRAAGGPRHYGCFGEVLRRRRCEQLGWLLQSVGSGGRCAACGRKSSGDGVRGRRSPPWRRRRGKSILPSHSPWLVEVFGRKPRSGWIGAMAASSTSSLCGSIAFEDAAWRFRLSSSGARCCPKLSAGALCTPLSASPRRRLSRGLSSPAIYSSVGWCVGEESQGEASFFGSVRRRSRCGFVA